MNLKDGGVIKCPNCDEEWEGVVEDYVIANVRGIESESIEQCGYCDVYVRILREPDGSFFVEEDEVLEDEPA